MRALLALALGIPAGSAFALSCVSQATGIWSSAATWSGCGGGNPGFGDSVRILSPHVVTQNIDDTVTSLTIDSGAELIVTNVSLTVSNTTNVAGKISFNSATGLKRFSQAVSIAATGNWNNSANSGITFRGGLQVLNGAVFTAGTGAYLFSISPQSITGTAAISIPNIGTTVALTNAIDLTNALSLAGSGSIVNAATGT